MALSLEQAKAIWRYDPETGHFFWLVSPSRKIVIGNRAGHQIDGRWRLYFDGKGYKAGRVAWLFMTGEWPSSEIDHINRQPLDNRFVNLRPATRLENSRNTSRAVGVLGVKGVVQIANSDRYFSRIRIGRKKRLHLGCFDTIEEAKAAYDAAVIKYHGEFAAT
ncbi:HNH endonuclease [Candidatus Methylomirabilis sp.]|uniref:HNH endonuclease n=1 Tax=Candidatus Methylomirabilis sp. TaxID=2032687 RepID=UPI003C7625F9